MHSARLEITQTRVLGNGVVTDRIGRGGSLALGYVIRLDPAFFQQIRNDTSYFIRSTFIVGDDNAAYEFGWENLFVQSNLWGNSFWRWHEFPTPAHAGAFAGEPSFFRGYCMIRRGTWGFTFSGTSEWAVSEQQWFFVE
jgi:hypothetical protein